MLQAAALVAPANKETPLPLTRLKAKLDTTAAVTAGLGNHHADVQGLLKAESAVSSTIATVIFVPAAAMTSVNPPLGKHSDARFVK